jgi:hypothetical protein
VQQARLGPTGALRHRVALNQPKWVIRASGTQQRQEEATKILRATSACWAGVFWIATAAILRALLKIP